jgi:predicted nucleic acid-binding protein
VILVDSSVWIEHLRRDSRPLRRLLEEQLVLVHPFILGEIACGHIKDRHKTLSLLQNLPSLDTVDDDQILHFIEQRRLMGRGVGLIDIHILASCLVQPCLIWTIDRRLRSVAKELDVAFDPANRRYI